MSMFINKVPNLKLFSNLMRNSVVKQSCAGYVSEIEINQESKISPKVDFDLAIAYGEKVVGYPATFSCIRWLLKDDTINFGYHMKQLAGTNHPLLATVKWVFFYLNFWGCDFEIIQCLMNFVFLLDFCWDYANFEMLIYWMKKLKICLRNWNYSNPILALFKLNFNALKSFSTFLINFRLLRISQSKVLICVKV